LDNVNYDWLVKVNKNVKNRDKNLTDRFTKPLIDSLIAYLMYWLMLFID